MKHLLLLFLVGSLAGCGGYHKAKRGGNAPKTVSGPVSMAASLVAPIPQTVRKPFARGPIEQACMSSDRKARSRELCGCIQAVANDTLSGAHQRRAIGFYRDPHQAQEVRQSDSPADRDFWTSYRAFGDRAERICR